MPSVFAQKPVTAKLQLRGLQWFLYAWLPAAIMMAAIAIESTHTFSAANTTSALRAIWQALFGPVENARWEVLHHYIRKTGHFTGYGLLAATSLRSWLLTFARHRPSVPITAWRIRSAALALCTTTFVASCDEFHQYFMPDRTGTFHDVLLDTIGGLAFILTIALIFWTQRDKQPHKTAR